jgi:hypothetical protein
MSMSRLFYLCNDNVDGAPAWGGSTALGGIEATGDVVIATRGRGITKGRFRFGPKDGHGRFGIGTPSGRFVATVDGDGSVILADP